MNTLVRQRRADGTEFETVIDAAPRSAPVCPPRPRRRSLWASLIAVRDGKLIVSRTFLDRYRALTLAGLGTQAS